MRATNKLTVRVERNYEGPVDDLWWLWTTKEGFESWWGPEGFRVQVNKLELCVGGALDYDMIATDPEQIAFMKQNNMAISHATHGQFVEVTPLKRLGISHLIDFIPGMEPYENQMFVDFVPDGKRVKMVITIDEHTTPEWTKMATAGMESQLTKVPGILAARRGGK
jgi:uncharacterized protein YndB with AHSA1/START domain